MAAILRVILGSDNSCKLILPSGIPDSVEELKTEIARQCSFTEAVQFRLQYRDIDFDNDFVNLTSTSDLQDKGTVKVIYLTNIPDISPHPNTVPLSEGLDDVPVVCVSPSLSCADTEIVSSPASTSSSCSASSLRSKPWPQTFQIPEFPYEVELQLAKAHTEFCNSGTLLTPGSKLKSSILEALVSEMMKYMGYPSTKEYDAVAQALVTKHPCLKEQGSACGYYGWKISLQYKMGNYRTKLRNIGCPEISMNSMKRKSPNQGCPNQVKKPRKAEVNYCPTFPVGETEESLEEERKAILLEVQKKNQQEVKIKMEKTFAYRRQEIVQDMPFITELRSRWPALFSEREVNAEFTRITTVPLLPKFMAQLDGYSDGLQKMFRRKGGEGGRKLRLIMAAMDTNPSIEMRRECVLKGLCVYVNEQPESLVRTYQDTDPESARQMEDTTLGIFVIKHEGAEPEEDPEDVGILIEGVEVLRGLRNMANASALLLGLIYCLNLSYPKELKSTFEVLQKVIMELDGRRLSKKVQVLKNRLHQ